MSRPVEIFRRKLGEDHPNTLSATSNLAMTYWPLGQSELAEPLYERSLASCRRLYGNAHPETLVAMYNLALTRVDLGKYAEAEALYQENYSNRVLIYKPDHPRTLLFLTSWADAATMRGDYAKADALYAQFMPIARRRLGETHITTLTGYGGLAELRRRQGRLVEAESILMMLLQKDRDSFALQDMVSLAQVRVQLGKYTEAMGDAQSAYQGFTKSDPENWERFHAQSLLGASLVGLRKFAAAEPALVEGYEGMLQRKSRIRVPARSVLAEAGQRLVDFYQSQGKPDKATEWKRKLAATQR